ANHLPAGRLALLGRGRAACGPGPRAGPRLSRGFPDRLPRPAQPRGAVLSSPGALALGPAAARAGAGRRRLDGPAVRGQSPLPHDAGPHGPPPRRARTGLAGTRLPPVPWYLRPEDRDASQFQECPARLALARDAAPDRGSPRGTRPAGRRP